MCYIADQASYISILDEFGHALCDIIQQAHGIAQEVH